MSLSLRVPYLFTSSQIHQVEFSTKLLLGLHMFLLDVDQEDAMAARAVLVHVCTKTEATRQSDGWKRLQL